MFYTPPYLFTRVILDSMGKFAVIWYLHKATKRQLATVLNRKSINFTFEESVEQSNLLLKVAVRCVLQLGALEVLARVKDVLNFIESGILVHEQQKRLQTLERGGGAARLQDEAPLRHEHAALTVNTNANCQLFVSKIVFNNDMI